SNLSSQQPHSPAPHAERGPRGEVELGGGPISEPVPSSLMSSFDIRGIPDLLAHADPSTPLRTAGDAIERLEAVARPLLAPSALEGDGIDAAIARFPDLAGSPE